MGVYIFFVLFHIQPYGKYCCTVVQVVSIFFLHGVTTSGVKKALACPAFVQDLNDYLTSALVVINRVTGVLVWGIP